MSDEQRPPNQNRSSQRSPQQRSNPSRNNSQGRGRPNPGQRGGGGRGPHPNQRNDRGGGGQQRNFNSLDEMLSAYDRLVELHLEARKKYFELFFRVDYNRRDKLEDQFHFTANQLIKFQKDLKPWQLEELEWHRTEIYYPDRIYSTAHPEGEGNIPQVQFVDTNFHVNATQRTRPSYREDAQESVGTFEDYVSYKASKPA